ncbi:hypothetical protein K438DRAFT_1783621 [Mycena galopus ATCC 62051]|nr:hypothetical protein K438DRAFT_1783621 [Mycena galopus ATCC 62051]
MNLSTATKFNTDDRSGHEERRKPRSQAAGTTDQALAPPEPHGRHGQRKVQARVQEAEQVHGDKIDKGKGRRFGNVSEEGERIMWTWGRGQSMGASLFRQVSAALKLDLGMRVYVWWPHSNPTCAPLHAQPLHGPHPAVHRRGLSSGRSFNASQGTGGGHGAVDANAAKPAATARTNANKPTVRSKQGSRKTWWRHKGHALPLGRCAVAWRHYGGGGRRVVFRWRRGRRKRRMRCTGLKDAPQGEQAWWRVAATLRRLH